MTVLISGFRERSGRIYELRTLQRQNFDALKILKSIFSLSLAFSRIGFLCLIYF